MYICDINMKTLIKIIMKLNKKVEFEYLFNDKKLFLNFI